MKEPVNFSDVKASLADDNNFVSPQPALEQDEVSRAVRRVLNTKLAEAAEGLRLQLADEWKCDESDIEIGGNSVFYKGKRVGDLEWDMNEIAETNSIRVTQTFVPKKQ